MISLRRYAPAITRVSLIVVVIALVYIGRSLPVGPVIILLKARIAELGLWGPLAFGLLYVVATLLFVPVVALTINAGVLFSLGIGTLIVSLASTTSAALTFLTARYLARVKVKQWIQGRPHLRAVDKMLEHGGWKIVVLLRLSALVPFSLQNYLYGLTPIGFWPYLISTWVAMLPGTFLGVYIGHAAETAVNDTRGYLTAERLALSIGLLATVTVSFYVTTLAKKKLREQINTTAQDHERSVAEQKSMQRLGAQPTPLWRATIAALVALLTVGTATYLRFNPDVVTDLFREDHSESAQGCRQKTSAYVQDGTRWPEYFCT